MTIDIKVTSDFICPWCLIGERRLTAAIAGLPIGIETRIDWMPFELNPGMPPQGMDRKSYRSRKFGSWVRSQEMDAHTVEVGREVGIEFDYAAMERTPNTFAAHRLSQLARQQQRQSEVVRRIFEGYFCEGVDIGDVSKLIGLGRDVGLSDALLQRFEYQSAGAEETRERELRTLKQGISSVPHFAIGDEIVTGAQTPQTLEWAILQVHQANVGKDLEAVPAISRNR